MRRVILGAAAIALAGVFMACGPTREDRGGYPEGETGELKLALNTGGGISYSGAMATLVVRSVFDHSQVYMVECQKKDHTLDGAIFCDELIVLPPGVYEVIVQTGDPGCRAERDWYKVIVKPKETIEIEINLICGGANGGLDVIVRKERKPLIVDIDFDFEDDGARANKFVCQHGDDVVVTVTVEDSDTACEALWGDFYVKGPDGWVTDHPLIKPGSELGPFVGEDGKCHFSFIVESDTALGSYDVKLKVTDGELWTYFIFPIHIIDCDLATECNGDLSNVGTGDFSIAFDIKLPATDTGTYSVVSQREVCENDDFWWEVRAKAGKIVFEAEGPLGNYLILESSVALNDGALHQVEIKRVNGVVKIKFDGVVVAEAASDQSFAALPLLDEGSGVCEGVDGTLPFPYVCAVLEDVCVTAL